MTSLLNAAPASAPPSDDSTVALPRQRKWLWPPGTPPHHPQSPPPRFTWVGAWRLLRDAVSGWIEDDCASRGAALAYYTLFSLAPLLLIVIAVAGAWYGPQVARGEVLEQLRNLLGDAGGEVAAQMLAHAARPERGLIASLTGLALMLIGATTVFAQLQGTLDAIWRAPQRPPGGLWSLIRARVVSFGLILGVGFLLMVSLAFGAAIAALQAWWGGVAVGHGPAMAQALLAFNTITGFLLTSAMFALIYKLMPRVRIAWADVVVGAVVTAALFGVGRELIGWYIGHGTVASGFGAAGSLVALLVWVYYSAMIFLLGAEFTWAYAHHMGSRRDLPTEAPLAAQEAAR